MNLKPLAKLLVERPRTVILVFTMITIIIGSQATNIYVESDLARFLPEDDPAVIIWNNIDEEFQIGSTIIIYVEANDIRDPDVLKEMDRVGSDRKINEFINDEGKQDGVISVRSLAYFIKEENSKPYVVGGLGGTGKNEIPDDENLIARYLSRTSVQAMKGTYYTNTYKVGVIIIQLESSANYDDALARTRDAVEHRGTYYSEMTVTGFVAMQNAIQEASIEYFNIILPIAIVLVSCVLFFFHRSIKGIIIILLPTAYAIALTFGVLGTFTPELTLLAVAVVALLLGLGVDYSIHIMNRFAEEYSTKNNIDRMDRILRSTGMAVFLSTITTMIGFGSLMISSMSPMVVFGFACSVGIFFCFISAIILTPTLSVILKFERKGGIPSWKKLAYFVITNKKRIIIISSFFVVMSIVLLPQIKTDVNYFDMAPENIPELEKLQDYSDNFGGANFNALLIETDSQGLTYPEVIDAIYNMEMTMREEGITVYSLADEVKRVNEILDRDELVERIGKFVGVDTIVFDMVAEAGLINEDFSKTLVLVTIPLGMSMENLQGMVNKINQIASKTYIPYNGYVSQLTGQDAINVAINRKLADEQTRSMIVAILLVLATLILIFSSSIYGFLTMIPVGFVLMWEPGFLVALDIPLSVVTISIASIMIGIGIDYGVHITHRIREEISYGTSKINATKIAIERTGLSLVEAASTTAAGVASMFFINILALSQFAIIIILMTSLSCIGAAFILPGFLGFKFVK